MSGGEWAADGGPTPIAVILGGPSAEHDVSIVSGTAIAAALAGRGHAVSQFCIDLAGDWWLLPAGHRRGDLAPAAYDEPAALGAAGPFGSGDAAAGIAAARPQPVAFVALHGPFGEDGTVQAILEDAGVPYTGAGVAASAIGMDKPLFKRIARGAGLPVLDWVEIAAQAWERDRAAALAALERLAATAPGGRLIAKPARLGSSIGMAIADGPEAWPAIVEGALVHDERALVEPCLDRPRELEMGVLGNPATGLTAFGPGEVIPGRAFYDYADKYAADVGGTRAADRRRAGRGRRGGAADRAGRVRPHRGRRASPGSTSCWSGGRGGSSSTRSTRSPASPRSASTRRWPRPAACRSTRSAPGSSSSGRPPTRPARPVACGRRTCPGDRGPPDPRWSRPPPRRAHGGHRGASRRVARSPPWRCSRRPASSGARWRRRRSASARWR